MQITSLNILSSNIPKSGQSRIINIEGESGAAFILQVVDSTGKFYDFINNTFVNGHIPRCNFKAVIGSSTVNCRVQFPAVSSPTDYNIIIVADPSTSTTISGNRQNINLKVSQIADTVITLAYNTANSTNYVPHGGGGTPPSADVATTLSSAKAGTIIKPTATLTNLSTATGGFGLKLDRQPNDGDLVFIATTTLDGTTSSSNTLLVDSTTDIVPSMVLVSGPNLSGTPFVTKVEPNVLISGVEKKRITLSTAQTLNSDGDTLTFHAVGPKSISAAIGVVVRFKSEALVPVDNVSHKVVALGGSATAGSDATLGLGTTYGVSKGSVIKGAGLGDSLTVVSVSSGSNPSNDSGSIEMSSAQNLSTEPGSGVGYEIEFSGFHTTVSLNSTLEIIKPGTSDRTLTLLLDNFITPGTAS